MADITTLEETINRIRVSASQRIKQNLLQNNKQLQQNLYKCSKCKDTGFTQSSDNTGHIIYKVCSCREQQKIKDMWERSGIKDLNASFKSFEVWNEASKQLKSIAIKYYTSFPEIRNTRKNSLMLCGEPGSGKTTIALALANNFIKQKQINVLYMPYRDVVTSLKQNILDAEYYKKTLFKYQTTDILFIDDLFKGKVNETDINITFEIVNYRYINNLPMIISTEYTLGKLLELDEAIASRLYEMSKNFIVQTEGIENNYRLRT